MGDGPGIDLATLYREVRERVTTLVFSLDARDLDAHVPTCPAWTVKDVVAHLVATAEDVMAGRLTDIPTDEFTADQVARFANAPVAERLAKWAETGPDFERIVSGFEIWPAVIDVASHEQDIRGAIGRPGERDCAPIRQCTPRLLAWLEVPVPLRVVTEDGEYAARVAENQPRGGGSADGAELALLTSRFEAFRWRMGRRSRAQLAAMAWSGDPAPVLDYLAVFGPASTDILEPA